MNTQIPHIDNFGNTKKPETEQTDIESSGNTNILNNDQYNEMRQRLDITLAFLVNLVSTSETDADIVTLNNALKLELGASKKDYATAFAIFIKYKERGVF
jgi:tRNA 2-selenouridine synthase SelU